LTKLTLFYFLLTTGTMLLYGDRIKTNFAYSLSEGFHVVKNYEFFFAGFVGAMAIMAVPVIFYQMKEAALTAFYEITTR
jgi:hypothetical protein